DPAWTTYSKRVLYSVYDVTSRLRSGRNAVGAILGEGWYRSRALLLQIEIELPDGKHFTVRSDTSWKAKNGPITSDSVYAGETWEPRFTYHGFRYVEVSGFPGAPGLDSLRGRVVHSAVAPAGNFVASKQILNQIQHLIHWGQLSNLFGLPTDCDQRNERQGWMGDAHVTAEEAMLNFDMAAFYSNFVRDMRD